jgi:hypothetical protein
VKTGWKGLLRNLFGGVTRPTQYIKPRCPICQHPLESFPGSEILMCRNGHRFGPGMKRVDIINEGDFHGEL